MSHLIIFLFFETFIVVSDVRTDGSSLRALNRLPQAVFGFAVTSFVPTHEEKEVFWRVCSKAQRIFIFYRLRNGSETRLPKPHPLLLNMSQPCLNFVVMVERNFLLHARISCKSIVI